MSQTVLERSYWPAEAVLAATKTGQYAIVVPPEMRRAHPTGVQLPCAPCAEAGIVKRGVPRAGRWSMPLCRSCWIGREQRRARTERRAAREREQREYEEAWERAAELAAELRCPACDAAQAEDGDLAAPPAAPDSAQRAKARARVQARQAEGCWLCGHSWLEWTRRAFETEEAERAEVAAAEAAVHAEAEQAAFERIAAVTAAETRVEYLTWWVLRCQRMLDAYLAGRGSMLGRPVELLADLAARQAATRATTRGRPAVQLEVCGVLALHANYTSGRGGMPGRAETAELVGCVERAVSSGWRGAEEQGWAVRVEEGRPLTEAERRETGRSRNRAKFDMVMLHASDVSPDDRARQLPAALAVYQGLLQRMSELLSDAQAELDEARAADCAATSWQEKADRGHAHTAVRRALAATDAITRAATLSMSPVLANKCTPPGGLNVSIYSCSSLLGYSRSPSKDIHRPHLGQCYPLRGPNSKIGASRASTKTRARPVWAVWAYQVASDLRKRWIWLRPVSVPKLGAILGAALGPQWTADELADYIEDRCQWTIGADAAITHPVAYLRKMFRLAFAADRQPTYSARCHDKARETARHAQMGYAAAINRKTAATHAQMAGEDAAMRAAKADLQDTSEAATATATLTRADAKAQARKARDAEQRAAFNAIPIDPAVLDELWPPVRQPGSGLAPAENASEQS